MSLKDAIREAVDERDKQQGEQGKSENADLPQNAPVATDSAPPKINSAAGKLQSRQAVNTASSKTVKPANKQAVNTASSEPAQEIQEQEELDPEEKVELAALTIRVSRQSRIHWLVSAKQQNTTLTAAIIEALNARFGEAGS